jgi:formylglycine-generating enzyme required for sulfatase activity
MLALQSTARAAPGDALYAKPGRVVPAGDGARLNLVCTGSGSPTVVFDSGWEDWSPAWAVVQPRVAQWTRACSYDRAGAGFSDPGPMPRTAVRIADELHTALRNAGIGGPYILVGHAFGGDCVRTFADRYPNDIAGLVLVESDATDLEPQSMQDDDHSGQVNIVRQLRECGAAVAQHQPLPILPTRAGKPPRDCAQQFFRGVPEEAWSPELNASVLATARSKAAIYDAYASEMEEMPADEDWLLHHRVPLGSRPIRVVSAGNHGVGHLPATPNRDPKFLEDQRQFAAAQARWLELSSNARQIFARDSSEYVQYDAPDTVVEAIGEVHAAATSATPPPPTLGPGSGFRDCAHCPEMVVIPAGHFNMGSPDSEKAWAATHGSSPGSVADEAPLHPVSLGSFALGKYEVTRDEYAAFVRETGYAAPDGCGRDSFKWKLEPGLNWRNPGFEQTDRDPVTCVNWQDAHAYASWLNQKAHSPDGLYRLPTEAEWEYAARAGSSSMFWWGDGDWAADLHAWYKDNAGGRTHPTGLKLPNPFGLYDMVGNVWQWTEDCYAETYANASADGSAFQGKNDCMRVDRGGSWLYPAWLLRPATRERNPPGFRDAIMGFRVAKTVP